ncbi:MAG: cytidylate kinase-like family protein [Ignavibacteriales bacterium]|nr:cytidylate kinase-like family protein [Ignavibacteriales bacterium]
MELTKNVSNILIFTQQITDTKKEIFPCITISRQTGSGSYEVSEKLIKILQSKTKDPDNSWTYFNKDLITKVVEEFKLPGVFKNYFAEDKYNPISDAVNELLGVKPSEWTIVHKSTEIILTACTLWKNYNCWKRK